jgi:type IV secretion system protein TrbL
MILTQLLKVYLFNFTTAMGFLTPHAMMLLTFFLGLELTLVGVWYLVDQEFNPRPLLSKILTVAVLAYVILNGPGLLKALARFFVWLGLQAGQSGMMETDFTDPDNIAKFGFAVTAVIFHHLGEISIWSVKNFPEMLFSGLTAWVIVLFYFGLAVWVFVSLIEFYYAGVAAVILLPFGMSSLFAALAEKTVGWLMAAGIRLFILAYLLSGGLPILKTAQEMVPVVNIPLLGPTFLQALTLLVGAMGLCGLCWRAGAFSLGLALGHPQFTAHDAVAFVSMMSQQVSNLGAHLTSLGQQIEKLGQVHGKDNAGTATPGRRP